MLYKERISNLTREPIFFQGGRSKPGFMHQSHAVAESFFHTLKTEEVYGQWHATRTQARTAIFEYIEVFYNRIRRHSALGYLSPIQFARKRAS